MVSIKMNDDRISIYKSMRVNPVEIENYTLEVFASTKKIGFSNDTKVYSDDKSKFYLDEQNGFIKCRLVSEDAIVSSDEEEKYDVNSELAFQYTGKKIMNIIVHTELGCKKHVSMSIEKIAVLLPEEYTIIYLDKEETQQSGYYIVDTFNAKFGVQYAA